jgi:hypothetical protein
MLPCLVLCVPSNSRAQAQITVSQGDCSQGNTPCTTTVNQQGDNSSRLDIEGTPPSGPGQVAIVSTSETVFGLQDEVTVVKNEPYQAQAVTEMKQTLADGSHIVQTTTATVARDSEGRTVRIQKLSTMGPWRSADSSQGDSQMLTTIFDPVAKEHIDYTSDSKVAHVLLMPPLPPGAVAGAGGGLTLSAQGAVGDAESGFTMSGPGPVGGAVQGFAVQTRTVSPHKGSGMEPKTESLGTKTIEGVQAVGTLSKSTIPAGTIGNDKDLVITRETWYSPELKLVIQSTQNDPRFGQTSYSLKNIQQGSPDEALFQVPADYKIDKVVPRIVKALVQ